MRYRPKEARTQPRTATYSPTSALSWASATPEKRKLGTQYLQRLKGQGLRRLRVEGEAGLSEERIDEVGSALDGPQPAADHRLELVEGGSGVVAQTALHR